MRRGFAVMDLRTPTSRSSVLCCSRMLGSIPLEIKPEHRVWFHFTDIKVIGAVVIIFLTVHLFIG